MLAERSQLQRAVLTAKQQEAYNEVLSIYTPESLDAEIEQASVSLATLGSEIMSGIDMPIGEMMSKESSYYRQVADINLLLQARDHMASRVPVVVEGDSAELQLSIEQLTEEITKAGYFEDIGESGFWPAIGVKRQVNSEFGSRWDPVTNASYSYHSGLDIYAPMSTPVGALFSGVIYSTGYSVTSGNYIYVDHGYGVKTFYCHLSEVSVTKGDVVRQGERIALSGNTGTRTTGPHLHLGVYIDGVACDPRRVLPDV